DEPFLKQFNVASVEGLRERARTELTEDAETREQQRLKDEIAKQLLAKTNFDLPQSIVEQETRLTARNMVQRIAMQGATRDQIMENRQSILEAATRTSTESVKLSYILSRIADGEGIQVAEEELDERLKSMAQRHSMPEERLRSELEKQNGIEGVRSEIRAEKTLDFLMENVKIKK
ncbi:hypothetical protein ACFLSJ_05325, partial [Verrucomicrobiota bacterium]